MYILWQWLELSITVLIQLYKQNRYRDTEIKGYVEHVRGVEGRNNL